jgi:hypothetical protein
MPKNSEAFLPKFFTIQEPNKRRPILDCQKLNQHVQCEHFKMEGVPALRELTEKDDYICKIDLKDAYTVVLIHSHSRQYLTFKNEDKIYQYCSLAFGLNVAPRVFSKLIKYAIEPLREKGIRLVYLDDICLLSNTKDDLVKTTQLVITHLTSLGFIINEEKSILTPSQIQEFFGVPIQYQENENHCSDTKDQQTHPKNQISIVASPEIMPMDSESTGEGHTNDTSNRRSTPTHSPSTARSTVARSLHNNNYNLGKKCIISQQSQQELQWWKQFAVTKNGLPIQAISFLTPKITIYTDSSETGWGINSPMIKTFGFWNEEEKKTSINDRELKAVCFALKLGCTIGGKKKRCKFGGYESGTRREK